MRQEPEQVPPATSALIALGANLSIAGEPLETTILRAVAEIDREVGHVTGLSRLYRTPCFPAGVGPDYVNGALAVATYLSAADVLSRLHQIEQRFGRERLQRWGMRTLDLDLVAFGESVMPDLAGFEAWKVLPPDLQRMRAPDELILPHPRLQDRSFVLVPLADVAPGWRHPVLGLTVAQMLAARPAAERAEVFPIDKD
jgi:2-amino-4-hydroxy-6-hydroxymethyldihydropteridine diphosphokinase